MTEILFFGRAAVAKGRPGKRGDVHGGLREARSFATAIGMSRSPENKVRKASINERHTDVCILFMFFRKHVQTTME